MGLQEQLENLIARDKSEEALNQLAERLRGTEEGRTIILLQSRWNSNKKTYHSGTLTRDDYNRENARINYALLSVIADLENNTFADPRTREAVQQVIQHITNYNVSGDLVQGDKIGGDKVMGDKHTHNQVVGDQLKSTDNSKSEPTSETQIGKKKILFIAANPEGKMETYSGQEYQSIRDALQNNQPHSTYTLEQPNFASNVDDFLRLLKRTRPAIVHLSMHGNATKGLVFQDAAGNSNYLSSDILASFFELINLRERTIECVILSVCNSSQHAGAIQQYVDYAVGMNGLIPAEAAVKYTQGFYDNLFSGDDYPTAHRSSMLLLRNFAQQITWDGDIPIEKMPVLCTLLTNN